MPELLYYAGLLFPFLFIIYSLIKYIGKITSKRTLISAARFQFNVAEGHRGEAQRKMLSGIREVFGKEAAMNVSKGELWLDMPAYLLLASKGRPGKVDETEKDSMVIQRMFFGGSKKTGKKYELEVSLKDQKVMEWRHL